MLTIQIFILIASFFVSIIPKIAFEIPPEIMNSFGDIFHGIAFFLPITELIPLFAFLVILDLQKLACKIIYRIKSFIPFMGN